VVSEEDDLSMMDENKNRHIKPDNIVALSASYFDANETASRGGTVRAPFFGGSWAFQVTDNYFFEGVYGRALLNNYPGPDAQTLVNQFVGRIKYNIKGPLYTFFMPYVGFQSYSISSPDAGQFTQTPVEAEEELTAIEELKKSGPVFGVTVLRRLVPGWFVKADIGTDVMNLGFAIEF
jgi:hypothetical protein